MVHRDMGKRKSDRKQWGKAILGLGTSDEDELHGKKTRFNA